MNVTGRRPARDARLARPAGRRALPALLAVALAACTDGVPVSLEWRVPACEEPAPLEGATHLELSATGPGMPPWRRVLPFRAPARIDWALPQGPGRRVEARAYEGEPGRAGRLLGVWRNPPFEVEAGGAAPVLRLFVRRVDAWTALADPDDQRRCLRLGIARAGHTTSALGDGAAWIAGGEGADLWGDPRSLAELERHHPATGGLSFAAGLGGTEASPRAFHTANLLPDGRLLFLGGAPSPGEPWPDGGLLFDPRTQGYSGVPGLVPRAGHVAVTDAAGRTVVLGGEGPGGPVAQLQWLEADAGAVLAGAGAHPRVGMAAALALDGETVLVAGGVGPGNEAREVLALRVGAEGPAEVKRWPLAMPRTEGALVAQDPAGLLLAGGHEPVDAGILPSLVDASELLNPGRAPAEGPAIAGRSRPCVVALEDGRVLIAGGRVLEWDGTWVPSEAVELVVPTSSGVLAVLGMAPLWPPRHQHTCTLLADGTILVAGGRGEEGELLDDLRVFTPRPKAP